MSEDDDNGVSPDAEDLVPNLSEDRPLDTLMPEMGGSSGADLHEDAPTEVRAVHPRVLEVGLEEGTEWTLACWEDPGPQGMHEQFVPLLEATLLREMSRLPEWERSEERRFTGMRVLSFDSLVRKSRDVLEKLGFSEQPWDPDKYSERMSAWRQEAQAGGIDVPARPISLWHLPVAHAEGRADELTGIEERVLEKLGDEVWGATPGAMSRHVAEQLEEVFGVEVSLGAPGLEVMQEYLTVEQAGAVRWMEPVFFQAICDFIGVCLHGEYGLRVQWGMCEPDPRGIVPPPMFRDPQGGENSTIPVGQYVLNWCVLPLGDREPPRLAEKVEQLADMIESRR